MSRHLPSLRPREVLRALIRAGFFIHHSTGSHHILKHPDKALLRVTLPWHSKDLKRRTLVSIIEQSGYTIEAFLDLL
jgi:predicted RNA binding protein YcfA (HicA-like mRNA interferase family)